MGSWVSRPRRRSRAAGTFVFKSLSVVISTEEIAGLISKGTLKVAGFVDEDPTQKGTETASYSE